MVQGLLTAGGGPGLRYRCAVWPAALLLCCLGAASGIVVAANIKDPFAGLPDPTRPHQQKAPRNASVTKANVKDALVVTAILISPSEKRAVINGKTVSVGQRVGQARVVDVLPYHVVLERSGRPVTVDILGSSDSKGMVKRDAQR